MASFICTLFLGCSGSSCTFPLIFAHLKEPTFIRISLFLLRAAAIYYVLCTYISPPTGSLTDVPVYPPMTIEEEEERLRSIGVTVIQESNLDTPTDEKESDFV